MRLPRAQRLCSSPDVAEEGLEKVGQVLFSDRSHTLLHQAGRKYSGAGSETGDPAKQMKQSLGLNDRDSVLREEFLRLGELRDRQFIRDFPEFGHGVVEALKIKQRFCLP